MPSIMGKAHYRYIQIHVTGRIVKHSGSITLKIASDIEKLELFAGIRQKTFELKLAFAI